MTIQYRQALGSETRAIGDESTREVEAKVCSYNVGPDTYNTTWSGPGCFTRGLEEALPSVCWSHQSDNVIGSVTGYDDKPDGLYVRMRLADFDAVPEARKAYSLIKDGHIRGWSFGFADGVTEPDKRYKGALAFRSAQIYEVSPVLRASVPLTRTVSVRSADGETEAADEDALTAAVVAGVRQCIEQAGTRATTITVDAEGGVLIGTEPLVEPDPVEATRTVSTRTLIAQIDGCESAEVQLAESIRSVVLTIADDGTVSASGYSGDGGQTDNEAAADPVDTGSSDAGELAGAVDAALDAMAGLLDGVDCTELPPVVQQALALADAAGVAVDQLLEEMGVPDPDQDDGDRAAKAGDEVTVGKKSGKVKKVMPNGALLVDWGDGKSSLVAAADADEGDRAEDDPERAAKDPKKPYGDVEYADPKNGKYPIDTADHVKAAWSYINQGDNAAKYPLDGVTLTSVKDKIKAAAKKFDIDISDSRSADEPVVDEPDLDGTRAALDLLATR